MLDLAHLQLLNQVSGRHKLLFHAVHQILAYQLYSATISGRAAMQAARS